MGMYVHVHVYTRTYIQTDRQTDRQTDKPSYGIAHTTLQNHTTQHPTYIKMDKKNV